MIEKLQGERIIPEKALNLELKYLDENVRPWLLELDRAYTAFIGGGGNPASIFQYALTSIRATIRINRLSRKEIEDIRTGFIKARDLLDSGTSQEEFSRELDNALDAWDWKIADIYMFAQPIKQQKESAIGAMLKELLKQEQAGPGAKV